MVVFFNGTIFSSKFACLPFVKVQLQNLVKKQTNKKRAHTECSQSADHHPWLIPDFSDQLLLNNHVLFKIHG